MKNLIYVLTLVLSTMLTLSESKAQTSMVYTLGLSPQMSPGGHYIFANLQSPKDEFTFDLAQVKASYFLGAGVRHDIHPFFFMAEAQYNKREYVYDIQYTYPAFVRTEDVQQYTETMHMINVPLMLILDLPKWPVDYSRSLWFPTKQNFPILKDTQTNWRLCVLAGMQV